MTRTRLEGGGRGDFNSSTSGSPRSGQAAPPHDPFAIGAPAPSVAGLDAVTLWAARIPWLGGCAWHHWFEVDAGRGIDRWEIWHRAAAGGDSWGHLHRNLLPGGRGVGAGPGRSVAAWTGVPATDLRRRIEGSPAAYPWLHHYRYWPGPNSNTWVQWVLGERARLGWRGHGRGFARRIRTGRSG